MREHVKKQASLEQYDIFLSHAYDDKDLILQVALTLEDLGHSVYLDWRDDPTLDRKNVTSATATKLRARMKASNVSSIRLTENSAVPNGCHGSLVLEMGTTRVPQFCLIKETTPTDFRGQEYLRIYPYAAQQRDTNDRERLWIHRSASCYIVFEEWLKGNEPRER